MDPFYIHKNRLTDGSIIWEIWQRGTDQRLASAAEEIPAMALASTLNLTCAHFEAASTDNTVDA